MMPKRTGYLDLGDGKVYYEVAGEGQTVVFVHAGIVDSRMWDGQWDHFGQRYSVIRYDMRGFGRSDRLEKPVSRRQELYRMLEATGVKGAALVGCSLGGEIVIDAALERPDLVSGLVVVSATPSGFEMQGEPPKELMEMLAAVEQGDMALASELQMRLSIDGPFRQPEQADPQVRRRAAEMDRAARAKGNWGLTLAPDPDPLLPPAVQRLDHIQAPALIVAGELDNPEIVRAAGVMASSIPGAQQVVLPGCAHFPNLERPAEFNHAVEELLDRALVNDQEKLRLAAGQGDRATSMAKRE